MSFGTVAILGPGLIGGSLALALAERSLARQIRIYGRRDATFPAIRERLPLAELTTNVLDAVRDADVVILCVPIETMAPLVKQFAGSLKPTALVTDVGSVKESVDNEIAPLLANKALWIGSHPMAGSEKSGFAAARPDLFVGARIILTPTGKTAPEARERAETFWQKVGASVFTAPPFEHDKMVAHISHLPHLAAAALVNATDENHFKAAGPGFRDTTRVASGSPDLWTEIAWDNREKIKSAIATLVTELEHIKISLEKGDKSGLQQALQKAHDQRSKFLRSHL
ncbi:MAG: prephenate dehydrogenase [Methylacidiphilales bacterium]|nr:prephenate dehydrogenase [Candidatus Methylacidiphilales bacterium]